MKTRSFCIILMLLSAALMACGSNGSSSSTDQEDGTQSDMSNDGTTDGTGDTTDMTTPDMTMPMCGDGTVDAGETCDDGNVMDGDGCSADCLSDETCGNSIIDTATGEACDDGNTTDGDGCQSTCALPTCGDNVQDMGEVCDDGNTTDGDGCNGTCMSDETCSNGVVDSAVGETCDDGNTVSDDGCTDMCILEECGDGVVQMGLGEACDDGNTTSEDGCSILCVVEFCGDGVIQGGLGEACDDGNTIAGDGCNALCIAEVCGDGVVQPGLGETCDDGNTMPADGCDDMCLTECVAGNTTFAVTSMIETFVVPAGCGQLNIAVAGAQGGNATPAGSSATDGGLGAQMAGDFLVTGGQALQVAVGQQPAAGNGGGGGSFVVDLATGAPLVVAGGGGGGAGNCCGLQLPGVDAVVTEDGVAGPINDCTAAPPGGVAGNGGSSTTEGTSPSAGGGGFLTNGMDGLFSTGGMSFGNGLAGGIGAAGIGGVVAEGGFGGGGGGDNNGAFALGSGGGGGGYSGGGGACQVNDNWGPGGGGGSFNAGSNQVNVGGAQTGDGFVTISWAPGPVPASIDGLRNGAITLPAGVRISGAVVTATTPTGFFAQDPMGGPYSGIFVSLDAGWAATYPNVMIGAEVSVSGNAAEVSGRTELDGVGGILAVTGNVSPLAATPVPASDLAGPTTAEPWESMLVLVENVSVDSPDLGMGEWSVTDGMMSVVRIDDEIHEFSGVTNMTLSMGDTFVGVQGPLTFSAGEFKILPRDEADFDTYTDL